MGRGLDVLVYGAAETAASLGRGLERLALSPRIIRHDSVDSPKPQHWAASVLLIENETEIASALEAIDRFGCAGRPVIAVSPQPLPAHPRIDAFIREPAPPVQIASRVRALHRLRAMELVAERRQAVSALYGRTLLKPDPIDGAPSILFVGDATPRFMAVQHAINQAGGDVIAAFSSYSAFDYLHERNFDAVILNALEKRDSAFTIASAMRRNARLYHTPVLLLSADTGQVSAEEAYARGVSDILPVKSGDEEIQERVLSLAEERRRRRRAKAKLESCRDPRSLDAETGLFHKALLIGHLQDLLENEVEAGAPLSLCVMSAEIPEGSDRPDEASAEKARRQFAAMLRHLLRAEDAGARLDEHAFAAILPFTDETGAKSVASRVAAIAECTAFESADPLTPFRLAVRSVVLELHGGEEAEDMIAEALRRLDQGGQLAALG